jgi:VIT1/CCC1 family predicted Fe2+/Mn2+ transporter
VAAQLTSHDALSAHARDELGLSDLHTARPLQAALTSAFTFAAGAALPLLIAMFCPLPLLTPLVASGSLLTLAVLGALAARAGGAPSGKSMLRVSFWGALAMAATTGIGAMFGTIA